MKKVFVAFAVLVLSGGVIGLEATQESTVVWKEIAQWKYNPQEQVVTTFFSCAVVDCKKWGISGGFYKAYFPDGFVLSLAQSGDVIDSYYVVSENNRDAFRKNLEYYRKIEVQELSEKIKKRISLMKAHDDPLLPILETYLRRGRYREGLSEIDKIVERKKGAEAASALGLRSIIYFLLGEHEKSLKDAKEAFLLDSKDIWIRRGASLLGLMKSDAGDRSLELLSSSSDDIDRLLQSLVYARTNEWERAAEIYRMFPEDYFLQVENIFARDLGQMVARSLKPYVESKKEQCRSLEKEGKFQEALEKYADLIRLADEAEAKKIRLHIAKIFREHPGLREMSEEARKLYVRAEVLNREGKHRESIDACRKALIITPFSPDLFKVIAVNYAGLKQWKTAMYYMNIYLELYPEALDARQAKDAIYRWEFMQEREGK